MTDLGDQLPAQGSGRKTCVTCFEAINARARRCRYCGSFQTPMQRWMMSSPWPPRIILFVMFVMTGSAVAMAFHSLRSRAEFADYAGSIRVLSSQMHTADVDGEPVVWVAGTVRNDSDTPWKCLQFEVQFLDADGRLMDVGRKESPFSDPPVGPGQEAGFKVKIARDFPADWYAAHKVFVRFAEDGSSRF